MASVRINVGAASDGSMRTVFKPLIEAAKEAVTQVKAAFKGIGVGAGDAFKDVPGAAAKATSAVEREAKRAADAEAREAKRAAKEKERAIEHVFQIKQRYLQQEEREAARSMAKQAAEQQKHAERTGYWSMRYMDRTMRAAGGFAMNMAKSAGVNVDLGTAVGKSVDLNKAATDLSNSAWQPNSKKKSENTRVEASTIMNEAMAASNKAALDPSKAIAGMQAFVSTTGDLQTAREIIGDLGILSRATGTDFDDMVMAAGEVSAKLGDIPDKGSAVLDVMRGLAGQGKLGAVEIRNVAKEMANVGSVANAFEGSAKDNMIIIGAMMQEARQSGGAKTASVAANAVSTFASYVTSSKGRKNLAANGIQPFADPGTGAGFNTKTLNPETIILAALMKSGGSKAMLSDMFRDKMAYRAVAGFATKYNETGGSQEDKLNAVRDEFARLKKAAMGQGEVADSFNRSMQTSEAQIQLFNNRITEVGGQIAAKLLPSLIQLGPSIVKGVEAFGKFVAWAVENPGKAVASALVASIARAQIETVVRAGIENLLKNAGGGAGGGKGVGGVPGAINTIGTALTIAATAVTIEQVGELVIDKLAKDQEKAQESTQDDLAKALNAESALRASQRAGAPELGAVQDAQAALATLQRQRIYDRDNAGVGPITGLLDQYGGSLGALIRPLVASNEMAANMGANYVTGGEIGTSRQDYMKANADASQQQAISDAIRRLEAALLNEKGKIQRVEIVGGMPMVGDKGRSK